MQRQFAQMIQMQMGFDSELRSAARSKFHRRAQLGPNGTQIGPNEPQTGPELAPLGPKLSPMSVVHPIGDLRQVSRLVKTCRYLSRPFERALERTQDLTTGLERSREVANWAQKCGIDEFCYEKNRFFFLFFGLISNNKK